MVLLKRLYSDTNLFDEIVFKNGINIILGKYSGKKEGRETNGIGKSTLIRLIDFALLSHEVKHYFDIKQHSFLKNHSFVLEFSVNDKNYQIKRNFDDNKIVYFGERNKELVEYFEDDLREILGNKFFGLDKYDGYVENKWYRSLMRFFVKDDINHQERREPINFIHPKIKKTTLLIYNFYLLGLPNKEVYEFDTIQEGIRNLRTTRNELDKKIKNETGKTQEELKSEIINMENKVRLLQKSLKDFKFLENYKDIENDLIEISKQISSKLKNYYTFKKELEDYQKSYKFELDINIDKVKELYNEINSLLADFVKVTITEVILFRKKIVENRKKFLMKREDEINNKIAKIIDEISKLEEERSKKYKLLEEKKAIDSIKNTYEQLIEEKAKIERHTLSINKIQDIEKSIAESDIKISELIRQIIVKVEESKEEIKKLILLFNEIIKNAIFVGESIEGAYFNINATPDRRSPVDIQIIVPKSDSFGKSRFKILAYDLTVLFNIIRAERNLPYFLIHDGVFHGIAKKTVINILNYINRHQFVVPYFQYIITTDEDEIYVPKDKESLYGKYEFEWQDLVIAKYEDIPEKMIFKRDF